MPKPVPYEQIRREVMTKRKLKPWEIMVARGHEEDEEPEAESPVSIGRAMSKATDPMALARKRQKLHETLAPIGAAANPETEAKNKKRKPHTGLMNLLMNMMAR